MQKQAVQAFRPLIFLLLVPIALLILGYRSVQSPSRHLKSVLRESGLPANFVRYLAEHEDAVRDSLERLPALPTRPLAIPLPSEYSASNTGGRLVFAQVADGPIGVQNRFMQSAFTLVNDCGYPADGRLDFYDDDGNPMTLTMSGVSASSFPITLAHGETKTFATAGNGQLKVGWARLSSDQPLAATCSFSIRDPAGEVFADVGVDESLFAKKFMLFADTKGDADTGVAVLNPDTTTSLALHLELINTSGAKVASTDFTLPPRGHRARFISELFSTTNGIQEFEGSLVISADRPFGGVTLRTVGPIMTSVPMVMESRPGEGSTRLVFPQIANGQAGGIKCLTSILVFNNTTKPAQVTLDFLHSDGSALQVAIAGQTKSSFAFALNAGGVRRLMTDGTGPLAAGWAKVTTDVPLAGAAMYHIFNQPGPLVAEVGVSPGSPLSGLNTIASSAGKVRTGVALVYADESATSAANVTLDLLDLKGVSIKSQSVSLSPSNRQALFVDELFKDVPNIKAFQGRLRVSGKTGLAVLTLRQVGALTTSVPTLAPQHGFAPASILEFPQKLTGSSPAIRWRLGLAGNDLALNTIKVEAPALGFDQSGIQPGDEVGYGQYLLNIFGLITEGGIVKLVATELGSVRFEVIGSGPGVPTGGVLLNGRMSGQPTSGLTLELGPTDAKNADWNEGYELELDFTLRPGLIKLPAGQGPAQIKTTYTSGSAKASEDGVGMVRASTQTVNFAPAASGAPILVSQKPAFFSRGSRLYLSGANWGAEPKVYFRAADGKDTLAWLDEIKPDSLKVIVPEDAVEGPIKVVNGTTPSNPLQSRTLFGPVTQVGKTALTGGGFSLSCTINQPALQLGLNSFEITLFNAAWKADGLQAGNKIGTMKVTGGVGSSDSSSTTYDVKVESVAGDKIKLVLPEEGETDPVWKVDLIKTGQKAESALVLAASPLKPLEVPLVNGSPWLLELSLSGLGFTQVSQSIPISWTGTYLSAPSDLFGGETGLSVGQDVTALP